MCKLLQRTTRVRSRLREYWQTSRSAERETRALGPLLPISDGGVHVLARWSLFLATAGVEPATSYLRDRRSLQLS